MKISIIVPVYNAERYLSRCINSVLSQSFSEFELILIDDGSQDQSGILCDDYAKRDSRIRVVHQSNQGQAAARNLGVREALGEWICFVDSDDLVHPQMLENLYHTAVKTGVGISMCSAAEFQEFPCLADDPVLPTFDTYVVNEVFLQELLEKKYYYWVVWAKLIRREIVEKYPFEEGRIYEDNAVVCKWLTAAGTVAVSTQKLYYYYVNFAGTTKNRFSEKRFDYLWALKEQMLFFEQLHYSNMWQAVARRYIFDGARFWLRAKNELRNTPTVRAVRGDICRFAIQYNKKYHLSRRQKLELFLLLHPCVNTMYGYGSRVKGKVLKRKVQR